jgi:glycerol kinase
VGAVLAIDQGTTSTRAIVFDASQRIVAMAQQELPQIYPQPGWVEHDPEAIWSAVLATAREALARSGVGAAAIAGLGIANQRETTLLWERASGRVLANAIVWQDRRTAAACERLRQQGHEALITARTGLLLDPYFSATKLGWLLDTLPGARARAEAGELAFGTVDCFLLWRLTGGRVHATDATNAARTALLDIRSGEWDDDLLRVFAIPHAVLPQVRDSAGELGATTPDLFGVAVPIRGMAGDQQAAALGQACLRPGMVKATYGTGCFALLHTGDAPCASRRRLLTTIACQLGGRRTYALEGAIFTAGAAVQWLRDGLGVIAAADESGALAERADPAQRVYLVPAFTGLGAPWWDPDARGALFGLTRATGPAELARAALDGVCLQTVDLIEAMQADWGMPAGGTVLRADGGMAANDWMMQRLADLLAAPIDRPAVLETTALGAAWLAGHAAGEWPDADGFAGRWEASRRFVPRMPEEARRAHIAGWRDAVGCILGGAFSSPGRPLAAR